MISKNKGAALVGALALLLMAAGVGHAQQQQQQQPGAAEKYGDALAPTQDYLQRRWLLLQIRGLAQNVKAETIAATLNADAKKLGDKGPSPQETAALDRELNGEIDAYLTRIEARIRGGQANWPRDRSPTTYANGSLIMLETARLELAQARAGKRDQLSAVQRANQVADLTNSTSQEKAVAKFGNRDAMVENALNSIRTAPPKRPAR